MDTIREFIVSSSGLAPARRGLGLGWVISVLSGVAILLGARGAEADDCPYSRECKFDDQRCDADEPLWCCVTKTWSDNGECEERCSCAT